MSFVDFVTKTSPKIIAVGLNYLKHVKEVGEANIPKAPYLFLKPWSSLTYMPKKISLPRAKIHRVDHEIQLGVFISKAGVNIRKEDVCGHIGGYFIGVDISDRVLQGMVNGVGFPYLIAKGQDNFCPVSNMFSKDVDPYKVELELKVNKQIRQKELAGKMHFKIDEIISYASSFMKLEEGDLILTGTPPGINQLKIGDQVECKAEFSGKVLTQMKFQIVS